MAIYLTVEWGTLKMDLARVVDAWCLQVMDLPDPGFFLHGRQVPLGWPQHHGPPWGGVGAHLVGSQGSEATRWISRKRRRCRPCLRWATLPWNLAGSWLLDLPRPESSPMTDTVWEAEGEAVRGDRERENKGACLTGSQGRAAPVTGGWDRREYSRP